MKRTLSEQPAPPPTTFGSARGSADAATESSIATFSDPPEPEPELVPDPDREANPDGTGDEPGADAEPGPPADTCGLLPTLGGGVIGYRQASGGRMVRMSGAARYLP